jgi:cyanate permease
VVVLGVCRDVSCVGFVGVVYWYAAAWGVVVVVLVEVGFGVGLRFCVARRFINADTYIAYISMCMGLCIWRHTPSGSVEMRHRPQVDV